MVLAWKCCSFFFSSSLQWMKFINDNVSNVIDVRGRCRVWWVIIILIWLRQAAIHYKGQLGHYSTLWPSAPLIVPSCSFHDPKGLPIQEHLLIAHVVFSNNEMLQWRIKRRFGSMVALESYAVAGVFPDLPAPVSLAPLSANSSPSVFGTPSWWGFFTFIGNGGFWERLSPLPPPRISGNLNGFFTWMSFLLDCSFNGKQFFVRNLFSWL